MPILVALKVDDGKWSDYAASIRIEILQHQDDPTDKAVRLIYNDKVLRIPDCQTAAEKLDDMDLCPLDEFVNIVKRIVPEKQTQPEQAEQPQAKL